MTEDERQQAHLIAVRDQAVTMLHRQREEIARVADKHPDTWTERDKQIAWCAICGLLGILYEGKI